MKVVLDTNVLISGLLLPQSDPGRIVRAWRDERFDLVSSDPMLTELGRVLRYPKIAKRLRWDEAKIATYLELLRFFVVLVDISKTRVDVPSDVNDIKVLATFVASGADYLVSGDSDLLRLGNKYPILGPKNFADLL